MKRVIRMQKEAMSCVHWIVLPKFSLELLQRIGTGQTKWQILVLSGSGFVGSGTCSVLGSGIWLSSQNRFELGSNQTFSLINIL